MYGILLTSVYHWSFCSRPWSWAGECYRASVAIWMLIGRTDEAVKSLLLAFSYVSVLFYLAGSTSASNLSHLLLSNGVYLWRYRSGHCLLFYIHLTGIAALAMSNATRVSLRAIFRGKDEGRSLAMELAIFRLPRLAFSCFW